jgi:hypothetical protein
MIGESGILPLGPEERSDKDNMRVQFHNKLTTAPDIIAVEQDHNIVLVVQLEQRGHIGMTPIKLHRPPDTEQSRDTISGGNLIRQ